MRIVIVGGPRVGKSTYATKLARELGVHLTSTGKRTEHEQGLVSTDNYIGRGTWAEVPDLIIKDLKQRDSFVLEGTQAARVLRRWMKSAEPPKLDKVLVFDKPWVKRTPHQESMAKGVKTTLKELLPMLAGAGVTIEHMTPARMTEEDWREHRSAKLAEAAEADRAESDGTAGESLQSVGNSVSDAEV